MSLRERVSSLEGPEELPAVLEPRIKGNAYRLSDEAKSKLSEYGSLLSEEGWLTVTTKSSAYDVVDWMSPFAASCGRTQTDDINARNKFFRIILFVYSQDLDLKYLDDSITFGPDVGQFEVRFTPKSGKEEVHTVYLNKYCLQER